MADESAPVSAREAVEKKERLLQNLFGSDDEDDAPTREGGNASDGEDDDAADRAAVMRAREARKKRARGGGKTRGGGKGSGGAEPDFDAIQNEEYVAPRTAEDDAFIDDAGVNVKDDWAKMSDDEDGGGRYASEAEESDDELEKLFAPGGKGKRRRKDEEMARMEVLDFLSKMEIAVEEDARAYAAGKPAVKKLKLLPEVEKKLQHVELHEAFLRQGLLNVLNAWLSLLPDGNLPNLTIRTSLLRLIEQLPVSTESHDRKEELKRSGLGRIILFLSNLPEETAKNRAVCKKLVEKWSRPVYALSSHYGDIHVGRQTVDDDRDRRPKKTKASAVDQSADVGGKTEAAGAAEPKYGEPGYRHHAIVPERSTTMYVKQPRLEIDPSEIKARTQTAEQRRVRQLVGKVSKAKAKKSGQAYTPSVEGRGLVGFQG